MNLKDYREKLEKIDIKCGEELRSHFATYLAVNAGLFILNIITYSAFPWFLFVLGGWGIGMASHWGNKVVSSKNLQDVKSIDALSDDELKNLIGFQKARQGFYLHIISNSSVSAFLITINIITYSGFMWSLIPMIGMGVGVASHWASYSNKKRRNRFPVTEDIETENITRNVHLTAAMDLRDSITDVIEEIKSKFKNFPDDLLSKIDNYVDTIALLVKKEEDLNNSLNTISKDELIVEKEKIERKREGATSDILKSEYNSFITDIDRHIETFDNLIEQKELLHIKISTSINSLKHLNLELVGMKSKTTMEDKYIIKDFEKKSSELALYYKDLLESYDELVR